MRLFIEHTTTFTYSEPVRESYTELRLCPREQDGQRCVAFSLSVEPTAELSHYRDHVGNVVHVFNLLQPHDRLVVIARSEVITPGHFAQEPSDLSLLERFDYLQPSLFTTPDEGLRALVDPLCGLAHGYDLAWEVMRTVHRALRYEKGVTSVATTAAEALAGGAGVCQDFSHVMVAACRLLGLPARYVSGYLYAPGTSDAHQASHAWVDVYVGAQGWVGLDPTHNAPQNAHYVRVAIGRDSADVPPTRGVFTGSASERMSVIVSVRAG